MANKVNNSAAQKKWDSLKGSAGVSLTRIVQGTASSSDFQRVQNVLNQQNNLASQVFKQAVSAAEVQAKKFQASYQAVLDKDNKEILSAFEVALNAELQKVTPDIVGQLKEVIEMTVVQSNEELDKSMKSRFESLKELIPKEKDVPTIHDLLAANDLLAERVKSDMDMAWEKREPDLLDKIANVFQTTLRDLADKINREKAQRAQAARGHHQQALTGPGNVPLLGHSPAPDAMGGDRPSILSQGLALLRGPEAAGAAAAVQSGHTGASSGGTTSNATVVALSPAAQHELTTAATAQKDFYERVKSLLPTPGTEGHGDAEEEGKEEKKADTWWRSFKNWFGGDDDKKKKKGDKFGWVKSLGAMLALMVLNPKLFKTLGDGIKNLLSWDNLKGAAEKSWDWISGQASKVMDSIKDLLGLGKGATKEDITAAKDGGKDLATTDDKPGDTKHASLNNLTPTQKADMDKMTQASEGQQKIPETRWFYKGLQKLGINSEDPNVTEYKDGHTDTNPKSPTYGKIIVAGKVVGDNPKYKSSTTVAAAGQAGSARTSVTNPPLPQNMPTGAAASTTFSESPNVKYSPGVSLPLGDPSKPAGGSASMQPQKGAPQIGIGSFGFNAANSDSLTLMNTYHFTAG